MGQFAQQEAKLVLIRLALGDVDGDRGRAEDLALLVGQGLDQQIKGALAPEQFEIRLELLRFSRLHRLALRRHDLLRGLARKHFIVALAEKQFRREAARGVVHPGEAHVLVLAEHGDRRAAQRDLEALLGESQFLGACLRRAPRADAGRLSAPRRSANARRLPPEADRAREAARAAAPVAKSRWLSSAPAAPRPPSATPRVLCRRCPVATG